MASKFTMCVRIVLRDRESGLYFREGDQWVGNAYDALTFSTILDAEAFCRQHRLTGMQIIQQSGYFFGAPVWQPAGNAVRQPAEPLVR